MESTNKENKEKLRPPNPGRRKNAENLRTCKNFKPKTVHKNVYTRDFIQSLKCFYTNADCLLNKIGELRILTKNNRYDIIAITETKPKHS